jgi:hypothetical protein
MLRVLANRNEKLKERVQERWFKIKGQSASRIFEEMKEEVVLYETSQTVEDYVFRRRP